MVEDDETDESNLVRGEYVQTEPKIIGNRRLRLGKWVVEELGWGSVESVENSPERRFADRRSVAADCETIDEEPRLVRGEYVQVGPNFLVSLKIRIGKWLEEERGR